MKESYFNEERINEFLRLWSDYDPDSTGWIHVDQLLFLIFELPIPYGRGKCNPEYTNQYKFDIIYKKRFKENYFQVKCLNALEDAENDENCEIIHRDVIKRIEFNQDIYLINEFKGLTIRETRAPLIMSYHKIPIYTGSVVNFKDVFQQIIKNAFDHTGEHYQPDVKVQAKFEKKWKKGIKRKDVLLEMVDEYMAGKMILNKYRLMHSERKRKRQISNSIRFLDLEDIKLEEDEDEEIESEEDSKQDKFRDSISSDIECSLHIPQQTDAKMMEANKAAIEGSNL